MLIKKNLFDKYDKIDIYLYCIVLLIVKKTYMKISPFPRMPLKKKHYFSFEKERN